MHTTFRQVNVKGLVRHGHMWGDNTKCNLMSTCKGGVWIIQLECSPMAGIFENGNKHSV